MMRSLVENFGWKVLSLSIAVVLWLAVVGEPQMTTSVLAPIEFRDVPRGMEISSETPDAIKIDVIGPPTLLKREALASVAVVFDLSSVYRPGERTVTVDESTVVLPSGVKLSRAVPSQLRLQIEHQVSRDVPIEVRFSGPPPDGYQIRDADVDPDHLRITGPESCVAKIKYAETDPVDLDAVVGEQRFQVHVYVPDSRVRFASTPVVTLRIAMEKITTGGPQR
ncbi:MAG: CdaR family protein [Bryobacteraceae bacterium]